MISKIINQSNDQQESPPSPFPSDEEVESDVSPTMVTEASENSSTVVTDTISVQDIVDKVTTNITTTLQTLIVSDRVLAAEKNSQDWKHLCQLMANNPELINKRMGTANSADEAVRQIGADLTNLSKVSI